MDKGDGKGATFLLDSSGNKIPTAGKDGVDGKPGTSGKDAVAPQMRINNDTNMWEISIDGGVTFVSTGVKATGEKGETGDKGVKGDAVFAENGLDNSNADYVQFTLANGTIITLPRYKAFKIGTDVGNDAYEITQFTATDIALKLPDGFKESDYIAIEAQIRSNMGIGIDIKTRTATTPWKVKVTKPTFTNGVCNNDAKVTVTPPAYIVEGENAMLEVTLVGNDGGKITTTRAIVSCTSMPFGDANFRKAVIELFIANSTPLKEDDGTTNLTASSTSIPLTVANKAILAAYTGILDVEGKGITSLSGIEYLTALTQLNCSYNTFDILDVSKNTELTVLNCSGNFTIKNLDISKNTLLTQLNCSYNIIGTLDVSKNTELTVLDCGHNTIGTLDISKNTLLTELNCSYNMIVTLDVSKNTLLTELDCGHNTIGTLDVSKNTSLTTFVCYENKLANLDVSMNTLLTTFVCYENKLATLDVSMNTLLTTFECYSNQLSVLDISQITATITNFLVGYQKSSAGIDKMLTLTLTTAQRAAMLLLVDEYNNNRNITYNEVS